MIGKKPWKILGMICLAAFLLAAPQLFAQDDLDDFGMDSLDDNTITESAESTEPAEATAEAIDSAPAKAKPEKDQVDDLAKLWPFKIENPKKDPFKPLVVKKVVLPPVRPVAPKSQNRDFKPKPPPVKPIRLFVTGIVGNEGARLAVVKFENQEHTIIKDQVVDGKFKVVDILSDRVVVYSNKEQRRHTFRIGGADEK